MKVPYYKKKWYVGTRIQKDLITYVIFACLFSQFAAVSHFSAREFGFSQSYTPIFKILTHLMIIGYFIYGFWLTNRIAGPLFRLKRHMDDVAAGVTDSEIQLRKNDYGIELAESFNAVLKNRLKHEEPAEEPDLKPN